MIRFEKVSAFKDVDFNLPVRKTAQSAGYDFEVAQDTIVPPFEDMYNKLCDHMVSSNEENTPITLEDIAKYTKTTGTKLTLVPTGVKCYLEPDTYLELSMRSSTPLKHWLVMGNAIGIIDADYADNPSNEGMIYFQVINLSPFPIKLKKGDIIGQGIIHKYETTDNDTAAGNRVGGFGSTSE